MRINMFVISVRFLADSNGRPKPARQVIVLARNHEEAAKVARRAVETELCETDSGGVVVEYGAPREQPDLVMVESFIFA